MTRLWQEIENTELCEDLKKIRKIYQQLEKKEKIFCDSFNIHCRTGCGKCCEHFTPDILEIEADYLAFGLIKEGRDQEVLNILNNYDGVSCPLYNKEDTFHHCSVYEYRPLICRLFGASASQNKEGEPIFKNCKWNEPQTDIDVLKMQKQHKKVVCMGPYGLMVDEIRSDDGIRLLMPEALTESINKINYLISLEEASKK